MHFKELKVWEKAHELTLDVYVCTKDFPSEEKFGLVSQLRRAVVSIEANLAEGSKKKSRIDFARFVNISEGSASEVEVLLRISLDVGYLKKESHDKMYNRIDEILRMLHGLRTKIESTDD
jgi:four helix bundle protein